MDGSDFIAFARYLFMTVGLVLLITFGLAVIGAGLIWMARRFSGNDE